MPPINSQPYVKMAANRVVGIQEGHIKVEEERRRGGKEERRGGGEEGRRRGGGPVTHRCWV